MQIEVSQSLPLGKSSYIKLWRGILLLKGLLGLTDNSSDMMFRRALPLKWLDVKFMSQRSSLSDGATFPGNRLERSASGPTSRKTKGSTRCITAVN